MKYNRTSLAAFAMAVLIMAAPTTSFAQGKSDHDKSDRDGNEKHGLGYALGHLSAPGWLKHNGYRYPSQATTTSPVISSLKADSVRPHRATISWNTDLPSTSVIWYGTTDPVSTSTRTSVNRASFIKNHKIVLTDLKPNTTYYAVVQSAIFRGGSTRSSQISFTTGSTTQATTSRPVANRLSISNSIAIVGTTSATLNWNTNTAANSEVYYSTTSPVTIGSPSTVAFVDSTLVTSHSLNIGSLATSTTYYMIIRSKDVSGNVRTTGQFQFTTGS